MDQSTNINFFITGVQHPQQLLNDIMHHPPPKNVSATPHAAAQRSSETGIGAGFYPGDGRQRTVVSLVKPQQQENDSAAPLMLSQSSFRLDRSQ